MQSSVQLSIVDFLLIFSLLQRYQQYNTKRLRKYEENKMDKTELISVSSVTINFFTFRFIKQILNSNHMRKLFKALGSQFSTITHIRGKSRQVDSKDVKLRGLHIQSTTPDSPTLIFIPEIFDQAQNWLNFFANPKNKIIQHRNVYILYPRNFGNSDHTPYFGWEDSANDIARFMYEHKISSATLGGHGIGGKIALAAACYHFEHVTGYFGIDSSPMNQFYHQAFKEITSFYNQLNSFNINRAYPVIANELRNTIVCPKWRNIFLNNLIKNDNGYQWSFNYQAIHRNLAKESPSNLTSWHSSVGLYPGRAMFAFPDHSPFVHLSTNTLPMYSVCPRLQGFNQDIFCIQNDQNPQNHWVYQREDEVNPFAFRIAEFLKHYDGVHVLLRNRDEVGNHFVPDLNNARVERDDIAGERSPAHYHHNWRFNKAYEKQ